MKFKIISILFFVLIVFIITKSYSSEDTSSFWSPKYQFQGEIRTRLEYRDNTDFNGFLDDEDEFLLTRIRLSLQADITPKIILFGQLQDSREFFSEVSPDPNKDTLDIYQAYVEIHDIKDIPVALKVGRQELSYGSERLIGAFGWGNLGRSFDAAKLSMCLEQLQYEIFWGSVVINEQTELNESDKNTHLAGIYQKWTGWKDFPIDGYLLLKYTDNNITVGEDGLQDDSNVYTIGFRTERKIGKGWDYNSELAIQLGNYGTDDIKAWASHAELGYTFDHRCNPRLSVELNHASGDDNPADGDQETFDNLYPTNHNKYGYMDLFSWRNMTNLKLSCSAKPTDKITAGIDLHFFWLDTVNDSWYSASGKVLRTDSSGLVDNFVGEELDLTVGYNLNKNWKFLAGYSHFFPEDYVKDTGSSDGSDWVFFQASYGF